MRPLTQSMVNGLLMMMLLSLLLLWISGVAPHELHCHVLHWRMCQTVEFMYFDVVEFDLVCDVVKRRNADKGV